MSLSYRSTHVGSEATIVIHIMLVQQSAIARPLTRIAKLADQFVVTCFLDERCISIS